VYTDANNSESPLQANLNSTGSALSSLTPNAQTGKLDGYRVSDVSFNWNLTESLSLRGGINNIENRIYATRRASGYPGPGIMPADGRSAYLGLGAIF
jgi:Fe(3+) dicitrate transport protein